MQKIKQLLRHAGADIDEKNKNGNTALILAEGNGHTEIVRVLLISGEDPEVIRVLLEAGADVNARDEDGDTALIYAAMSNENPEVTKVHS